VAEVESAQAYRVGDEEWYTAIARYHLLGFAAPYPSGAAIPLAGCMVTGTVLFRPDVADPRLTLLRGTRPSPLSEGEFDALVKVPRAETAAEAQVLQELLSVLQPPERPWFAPSVPGRAPFYRLLDPLHGGGFPGPNGFPSQE
jgi:hypothetical protein